MSDLRKIQMIQLRILLEVDKICKKHSIPYFLVGGTMLGAVRHGGFIPWDDDIDIGMLAKDYDRFLKISVDELPKSCVLQTLDSMDSSPIPWAKIRLKGTQRVDKSEAGIGSETGIDIDIFPYHSLPDSIIGQKAYIYIGLFLRALCFVKSGYLLLNREDSMIKRCGVNFAKVISVFVSKEKSKRLLATWYSRFDKCESTELVISPSAPINYHTRCIPRSDLYAFTPVTFEGYEFNGPKNPDKYLTTLYGDWRSLPPEDDRIPHLISKVDFGKFNDIDRVPVDVLWEYPLDE